MSAKLAQHRLSAESMPAIYDAGGGKPVLHNTALQLAVNYGQLEPGGEAQVHAAGPCARKLTLHNPNYR